MISTELEHFSSKSEMMLKNRKKNLKFKKVRFPMLDLKKVLKLWFQHPQILFSFFKSYRLRWGFRFVEIYWKKDAIFYLFILNLNRQLDKKHQWPQMITSCQFFFSEKKDLGFLYKMTRIFSKEYFEKTLKIKNFPNNRRNEKFLVQISSLP